MVGYHELPIVPQKVTDSLARLINILVKCAKHFSPLEVYYRTFNVDMLLRGRIANGTRIYRNDSVKKNMFPNQVFTF